MRHLQTYLERTHLDRALVRNSSFRYLVEFDHSLFIFILFFLQFFLISLTIWIGVQYLKTSPEWFAMLAIITLPNYSFNISDVKKRSSETKLVAHAWGDELAISLSSIRPCFISGSLTVGSCDIRKYDVVILKTNQKETLSLAILKSHLLRHLHCHLSLLSFDACRISSLIVVLAFMLKGA